MPCKTTPPLTSPTNSCPRSFVFCPSIEDITKLSAPVGAVGTLPLPTPAHAVEVKFKVV